jgi:hypothetical protein
MSVLLADLEFIAEALAKANGHPDPKVYAAQVVALAFPTPELPPQSMVEQEHIEQ